MTTLSRRTVAAVFGAYAMLAIVISGCSQAGPLSWFARTATPTATKTPNPTHTAVPQPIPTMVPSTIEVENLPDNTSLVSNAADGYRFILPENWMAVPFTEEDMDAAYRQEGFYRVAVLTDQFDPAIVKMVGFDPDPRYADAGLPVYFVLLHIQDKLLGTMLMAFVTAVVEDEILAEATSVTSNVVTNPGGLEIGIVEGFRTLPSPWGGTEDIHDRIILFQSNGQLIMLHTAAPVEFGSEVLTTLDKVIDSIEIIDI